MSRESKYLVRTERKRCSPFISETTAQVKDAEQQRPHHQLFPAPGLEGLPVPPPTFQKGGGAHGAPHPGPQACIKSGPSHTTQDLGEPHPPNCSFPRISFPVSLFVNFPPQTCFSLKGRQARRTLGYTKGQRLEEAIQN